MSEVEKDTQELHDAPTPGAVPVADPRDAALAWSIAESIKLRHRVDALEHSVLMNTIIIPAVIWVVVWLQRKWDAQPV